MTGAEKQARLARVYDEEIVPSYAGRAGALLLRRVGAETLRGAGHVVEAGCATGHLTRAIAALMTAPGARLTAVDEREPFVAEARAKAAGAGSGGAKLDFAHAPLTALPVVNGAADVVVSNLAITEALARAAPSARIALLAELARVLTPDGRLTLTAPLRGTWGELLDLLRDVLREGKRQESLTAVERYAAAFPDGGALADLLRAAHFADVDVTVDRWEILFKSAREFFFAPLIELGPLSQWKQLAGRGADMQDAFFFTKEAIDAYFKGRPFAVTVVAAAVSARKPA